MIDCVFLRKHWDHISFILGSLVCCCFSHRASSHTWNKGSDSEISRQLKVVELVSKSWKITLGWGTTDLKLAWSCALTLILCYRGKTSPSEQSNPFQSHIKTWNKNRIKWKIRSSRTFVEGNESIHPPIYWLCYVTGRSTSCAFVVSADLTVDKTRPVYANTVFLLPLKGCLVERGASTH